LSEEDRRTYNLGVIANIIALAVAVALLVLAIVSTKTP
jgi:hypothetical protein